MRTTHGKFLRALTMLTAVAVVGTLAILSFAPGGVPGASANTFTVTNTSAGGSGSLAQAIADAAANPGPDAITFSVSGTIDAGAALTICDAGGLTIDGAG